MDRRPWRRIVRGWSLEWKLIILLGTSLLVALWVAFWAVQIIAERLVIERTRQVARDYASLTFLTNHFRENLKHGINNSPFPQSAIPSKQLRVFELLSDNMLGNPVSYSATTMRLQDTRAYSMLEGEQPQSELEIQLLEEIAKEVTEHWYAVSDASTDLNAKSEASDTKPPVSILPQVETGYIFREAGPIEGNYYYYHPIRFTEYCFGCHHPLDSVEIGPISAWPFRVIRVGMPYEETRVWTAWSFSLMIAIAIATSSVTMFIFHLILKTFIIRPIIHLREVSDEVSHGRIDLRATIDTDDEIHDLAEAFNRMVLHLTESEMELRTLNKELDRRVDQLAQVNLQLFEANRLKSEFLANMSHELRTPLNSILGFSEVLQGFESLNDRQKRYAANIQRSGRLLLNMINDILDLAKVEAGKMEVRPTHFDLILVVRGQCDIVRSLSEEKNIDLQVESTYEELPVYQDQAKIQQILTNLLSNAIKFTPEGGLITVSAGMAENNRIFLSVADTGVGIAESDFEIIFEKFRQSKSVTGADGLTREYTGTGLGLSIVRELCKLLGGEVMLSSHLGQGSTFRVELDDHYLAAEPMTPNHLSGEPDPSSESQEASASPDR